MPSKNKALLFLLLGFFACSQPDPTHESTAPAIARGAEPESAPKPAEHPNGMHQDLADEDVPVEKFGDGAKAFAKVRETLLANYYAEGVTEDDLYRAATAGMLEKVEPRMKKWNKLLSPREIAEIKNDLHGEVVGIGVHIQFDSKSGYADVLATIPGSPSEKAGLVAGDKIVTVNGKLYKGMRMKDVVADIRGKAGEPVTLSVLRADKLVSFTITRDRVVYDQPLHALLPDNVGWVRIPSFTDKTPSAVRASLEDLEQKGAKALIVDLRQSPGGHFERALETASLFLPEGTPIVTLQKKNKAEETHKAKGKPVLVDVPVAVLVNEGTASGAEILTGALREGRSARVIGNTTLGKWSVQSLDDLPNGYAFKYTVSLFKTPSGASYEGKGLTPDVQVAMDEQTLAKANASKSEERLANDVQLRTAKELLVHK